MLTTNRILPTLALGMTLVLSGCSDSDVNGPVFGNPITTPPTRVNGTFIDAVVDGLEYKGNPSGTEGITGDTGTPGGFEVEAGDTVIFSIGNLVIGTTEAVTESGGIFTPATLAGDAADAFNPAAIRIARLLQSLDCDGDTSNGIDICDEVAARLADGTVDVDALQDALDGGEDFETVFGGQITDLMEGLSGRTDIVSAEDAHAELQQAVNEANGGAGGQTTIALEYLGNFLNPASEFETGSAEIVAYDPQTQFAFVVNALSGNVDVVDISSPASPTLQDSLDVLGDVADERLGGNTGLLGAANSVTVHDGIVAVAIEANPKQTNGYVAFYQISGFTFLSAVEVGALPDMLTFTPDGTRVVVANEGEPNGDYSNDPQGTVSIINVSGGAATVMDSDVTTVDFEDFNTGGSREDELEGMRLSLNRSASVAQDIEPEYIGVSSDSKTAYASLQENNAVARIDLETGEIIAIGALGFKDYTEPGNMLDASDDDGVINITHWPVFGVYMPDTIAVHRFAGKDYVVTANEGDAREYITETVDEAACETAGGIDFDDGECLIYLDEIRIKDLVDPEEAGVTLDNDQIEAALAANADLFEDENLGRLNVITNLGVVDPACLTGGQPGSSCIYTGLYSYGGRSFSIFDGETGNLVFDSGGQFETVIAEMFPEDFNSDNTENGSFDSRSDAKGPEPEALELGTIDGRTYAFIGLERMGGIMVYDITNPGYSTFVQYINPRNFSVDAQNPDDSYNAATGDLGPESIVFISAENSPNDKPLLLVGNEISGTTGIYQITIASSAE